MLLPALLAVAAFTGCNNKGSAGGAKAVTSSAPSAAGQPELSPVDAATGMAKRMADAFNAHDAKAVAGLYAENGEWSLPGEAPDKGRAAIEKHLGDFFDQAESAKRTIGRIWVDKNVSVVEWLFEGKRRGKRIGYIGASVVTLGDDGLIVTNHTYFDRATAMGQVDPRSVPMPVRRVAEVLPAGTDVFESKGTSDEAKNVDTVNKMKAALHAHKLGEYLTYLSDDTAWIDFTKVTIPMGKKDAIASFKGAALAFPDLAETHPLEFGAGDYVIMEVVITGTNDGPIGTLKPTHGPVTLHALGVHLLKEGKEWRGWSWSNSVELITQVHDALPVRDR